MNKPREIEWHAGHWRIGSGASGYIDEVTEARRVVKRCHEIMVANKIPSSYFFDDTSTGKNQNLGTLVKHHNKDRDGLVVSVHFNASAGTKRDPIGTEVLYYDQKNLALKLSNAIASAGGFKNRGPKQNKQLAVLAQTYEPAVLPEICFVNSKADVDLYKANFEPICQAICKVLAEAIGHKINANVSAKQELWAIKSGTYNTKSACEGAIQKSDMLGIVSAKWCKIVKTASDKYYFVTGTFSAKSSAEGALKKMKDHKVLYVGNVIEA